MTDILIPQLSENISSGTVIVVNVKPGDKITQGQTLLELETEKAVLEVPSPIEGTITEILINTGDEVNVGQLVFRASTDLISEPRAQPAMPPISSQTSPDQAVSSAAPDVRRLARESGINIEMVSGTGPSGRITAGDIKSAARQPATVQGAPGMQPEKTDSHLPDFSKWGEISTEPMSPIRKTTAENIFESWTTIPHVTQFAKVDITKLEQIRLQYTAKDKKISILPFIIKIVTGALKAFPRLNSAVNMANQSVIYKKYYNIGIAVDTEHGLLVPVIHNVDQKSTLEIADELIRLVERARSRKLTLPELQGGTFTITNLGNITNGHFTPIIRNPEVAILGLSRAQLEPHYDRNASPLSPRLLLPLSLSYDHRVIDGAEGARFIAWICDTLEQGKFFTK